MPPQIFQGVCGRRVGDAGWVSVFYPVSTTYEGAFSLVDLMNTQEISLLPDNVLCDFIRISEVHTPGDAFTDIITTVKGSAPPLGPSGTSDPNLALPIKLEAGLQNRATKFLRGMDSAWIVPGVDLSWHVPVTVQGAFDNYLAFYKTQFGVWNKPGKRNGGVEALIPITKALAHGAGSTGYYYGSIRRAGRPFGLRRGRRPVA